MASREVEILQASYDLLWRHGRLDPLRALEPDFEWVVPGYLDGDVRRGPEEVTAFFEEWIGAFDHMEIEYEFRGLSGERVLALVTMRGVGRESGAPVQMWMAQLWTFDGGKARRMVFYDDPAEAFAAAGLTREDVLRWGVDAFNRKGAEGLMGLVTDDIVWKEDPNWPDGATWHGREGVRQALTERMESTDFQLEIEDIAMRGDRALVTMRWSIHGRGSGAEADWQLGMLYTFRGHLVSRLDFFIDREQARSVFDAA